MNHPRDDDETTLGAILLEMGLVTPAELALALEKQENSTLEERIGMVLVHCGFCTPEEVELALSAQKSMRSGKDKDIQKAIMSMDLAIHRKRSNGARSAAIMRGVEFRRASSGSGFQAITPEVLAKASRGR